MTNSSMFSTYLSDPQLALICSEERFVTQMLTVERVLAIVQGQLGIIPPEAASAIADTLPTLSISPDSLAAGTLTNGVPTIPLLALVRGQLPESVRPYLHWGATSQDVMDTAQVLIIKAAIDVLESRIHQLVSNLTTLQTRYGDLPMTGRTRTQQAMPIVFGDKINAWSSPLVRHLERLDQLKPRLLVVQLGGAVGNLSALGEKSVATRRALANELGLIDSASWHTQRDGFAEFTNWLALLSGSLGKIGQDILLLNQSEIGEVVENKGGGGQSSSMPHKSNPVLSEALVMLARQNAQLAAVQLQSLVHGNERDATAWMLEWDNLPRMILNTGTALRHALSIAETMGVDPEAMQTNLNRPKQAP